MRSTGAGFAQGNQVTPPRFSIGQLNRYWIRTRNHGFHKSETERLQYLAWNPLHLLELKVELEEPMPHITSSANGSTS